MLSSSYSYTQDFFAESTNSAKSASPANAGIDTPAITAFDESFDDPYLAPWSSLMRISLHEQRQLSSLSPFPSKLGEFLDKTFDEYVARSLHKHSVHTRSTTEETISSHVSLSSRSNVSFPDSDDILLRDIPYQSEHSDLFDRVDHYKRELRCKPSSPSVLTKLGLALMNVEDFPSAVGALAEAAQFWRKRRKSVALARVLDRQGACLTALKLFEVALECFNEAYSLRHKHLGPWHIDTIDSRKSMGNVYFSLGQVSEARKCLFEVFWVQKAVFRTYHITVAMSAHDLAKVMTIEGLYDHARNFYKIAWNIYNHLRVPPTNSAVEQLLLDINHLTRLLQNKDISAALAIASQSSTMCTPVPLRDKERISLTKRNAIKHSIVADI